MTTDYECDAAFRGRRGLRPAFSDSKTATGSDKNEEREARGS
jgi:hypothetical protein